MGRLQKYPKIHVSTAEETSGSGTDSHKVLGPGIDGRGIPRGPEKFAWGVAFSEAPRAVVEVPVVSRQQLPYLEKIQEVVPSRRDEAHFR